MAFTVKHKRSGDKDKAPAAGAMTPGELAINYNVDSPAAYIKDSAGNIVKLAGAGSVGSPDASETVKGIAEIATKAEVTAGTDDATIVTPLKLKQAVDALPPGTTAAAAAPGTPKDGQAWFDTSTNTLKIWDGTAWKTSQPAASETVAGIAELATQAEVTTGTDTVRAVTPATLKVFVGAAIATGTAAAVAPTGPVTGQMWIDTSKAPPVTNVWDGAKWVAVGAAAANASETVKGIAELATQAEVTAGTDDARIVTPLKLATAVPAATETKVGKVELATAAETKTGTDATRAVHPAGLKAALDLKLNLAGGNLTGGVTQTERTITTAFDLATGNFWTCGAIAIPNPTNVVAGMSGLIRLTAAPSGWGGNFSTAPTPKVFPSIVPFYVESATKIRLGSAVVVA